MNSFGFILSYFLLNEKLYNTNEMKEKIQNNIQYILYNDIINSLSHSYIFADDFYNYFTNNKFNFIKKNFINPLFLSKDTCDYNIDIFRKTQKVYYAMSKIYQ